MEEIKLTQYSHGAGCGCKISPAVLDAILHSASPVENFPALLVGNETKDDAAVYDPGDGNCIISTTDFFMPIVDDAFTFGQIASVNAISDVYAMGGTPLMALAILGWPVGKLSNELAQQVLEGARKICREANIPLAGGHSIDSPEPIFGLAVTGSVRMENLKKNNTATENCLLYLTKPLGVGIITTAQKRGLAEEKDIAEAVRWMTGLNTLGAELGKLPYVTALTDVTGFGLLGHLIEVCEGSGVSAEIQYDKIPLLDNLGAYTSKFIYPDNTMRNWQSYEKKVSGIGAESLLTLCDPQTSGGLLICVEEVFRNEFEERFGLKPFGKLTVTKAVAVEVQNAR
ncbi:MAG TPA: selenide, water dikinase SelD [Cyclobacteriaceae bacterium]|nr:selenide, water dikinase SelD [Cyclobacteriaceae bacterium]HMV08212.1 selenide, water dikinase SelD [Cyclobacteriaceae bacterium]HMV89086.1 selenide, water dikinase SelD [Cyclobacteriaceae bacterium]HMX02055.1 selenide, water dikinase SelD [Cyclobacteriaceae bacterium]HMX49969.1 selenide, water dikinase SelD [Cyclobacteriaceae bacterium]